MSRSFLTGLNLNKNELLNARIQNLANAPTAPVSGQIYFNTGDSTLRYYNGSAWLTIAQGGSVEDAITTAIDALTTDVIEEGSSNLYYTTGRAKTDAASLLTGATLTNITITGDGSGLTISAENGVADSTTSDLAEGSNLYFTDERAQDAVGSVVGNGLVYNDTTGAVSANIGTGLEFNAGVIDVDTDTIATKTFATGEVTTHNAETAGVHGVTGDVVGTTDAQTISNKTLGSSLDAGTFTVTNLGAPSSDSDAATKLYVDTSVAGLVDSAPELLNTLNELAAAIGDDANFASTIATDIGTKVSKSGDTMTGALTLSGAPTSDLHAATKAYVDTEIADAIAEAAPTTKYSENNALLAQSSGVVTWPVVHGLSTRDVTVQVYELSTYSQVEVDVARTSTSTVTLSWVSASDVTADTYRVVVVG